MFFHISDGLFLVKELSGTAQKREDSLAWFEKDLSDFELSEDEQSNCLKKNEGAVYYLFVW